MRADIVVVGAGAAGLFAAIWAGRTARLLGVDLRIVAVDGAKKLGAKILVAGGGRCNVTHHEVTEAAYAGSTRGAVRSVLRRFPVEETVRFFGDLGVELKREETGKLFPVTDSARTVLDALLRAARDAGVEIVHPWRVGAIERDGDGFVVRREDEDEFGDGVYRARRVVVATGGKSLPKTGSDGAGYGFVRALGHTTSGLITPALVPLVVEDGHVLRELSGVTLPAVVEVRGSSGKRLARFANSTLCTHFGLSGPSVLDASRYWLAAREEDAGARVVVNWGAGVAREELDRALMGADGRLAVWRWVSEIVGLPERFSRAVVAGCGVDPVLSASGLKREERRLVAGAVCEMDAGVVGDRGYKFAEVTAGGVALSEMELGTMASRVCAGLHLCGEICDVDGRIGGFNFQWAWASGFAAGRGAVQALAGDG